jgi:Pretoxin HINT domain
VLSVTAEHPFFSPGKGWTTVRQLATGDRIASDTGGDLAVVAIETDTKPTLVYNLEVAQDHAYFVGDGSALAHNAGFGNKLNGSDATLYELLDSLGNHLKCGITNNSDKRYTKQWLAGNGYELQGLVTGPRNQLRQIEKGLNEFFRGPLVRRP